VSPEAASRLPAVEALRLLRRTLSGARLPPPAEPDTIELLGWLELPLDDAPALVVTGFDEGRVPEPVGAFPLLPEGLRRALGLPDDARRLARDAYALTLLARSGRELLIVSGRRNAAGDPLRPSRLMFLAPEEQALARARLFGSEPEGRVPETAAPVAPPPRALPRLPVERPVTSVRVTAFKTYLRSPYRFYLEQVARLRREHDDARELDPLAFGSLAHEALELLAGATPSDPAALGAVLGQRVDALVAAQCGAAPPAAVLLQAENLKYRLAAFARWHARQFHEGWRVARVEWAPEGGVPFDVDGGSLRLTGRIDRIDVHARSGAWRIIDYKTSESGADPGSTHRRRDGTWTDLQLPLYVELARPLLPELVALGAKAALPQLGYVVLPHVAPPESGFWLPAPWGEDDLADALAEARRVGGCILRGEFDELKDFGDDDELLAAIAGLGLVGAGDDDEPRDEDEA
jgi:hypothetical protein